MEVWSWPFLPIDRSKSKKQKCYSLSCPWSRVQRDTSGPGNSQTLGCLWTKHHVPVCEIEPRRQLFPPGWEQRLYKFCFIWVKKYVGYKWGTICSHWNTDYLLENLSRKNHENVVYQKLKHLDDVIFRVLVFGVRVFLYKVWFFVTQN